MKRSTQLEKLSEKGKIWDMVVVGGGATGLGVAVDAASRGYSVALLEKTDFAKCTSSRSTKLVHGGVRYLQHGDVMLVLEALRERGRMKANAPHLVKDQAFVISNYSYWDNFLYFCGLTFYDMLSFGFGYGRSKFISAKKVMKYIPTSVEKGLKGGVVYHDGQFDDSRMAITLMQSATDHGAMCINYILENENRIITKSELMILFRNELGYERIGAQVDALFQRAARSASVIRTGNGRFRPQELSAKR